MDPVLSFASVEPEDLCLGHEVAVDELVGAARLTVPLPVPPGRSGFQPACALQFTSSAGNSPFGTGWSLTGMPFVGVDDRRGHPTYGPGQRFLAAGAELVATDRVFTPAGKVVRVYRARNDDPLRYEHVTDTATGVVSWRARHGDGTVSVFGAAVDGSTRIADPADPHRTHSWLLEARYDAAGNAITYGYVPDDLVGVSPAGSAERHRLDGRAAAAQRYLKRIRYGNTRPLHPDTPAPADNRWLLAVTFDYGAGTDGWPVRPDPHSTYRPGFEVRTYRLCRRVLVHAEISELGPGPTLLGELTLEHTADPAGSTLRRVHWTGHRRDGSQRSTPPLDLDYAVATVSGTLQTIDDESRRNLPQGLTGVRYQAVDLYGEGLPGVLTETPDAWWYKPNLGDGRLGQQVRVGGRPAPRPGGGFVFSDFDRDGNPNLVQLDGAESGFYEYDRDGGGWRSFVPFASAPRCSGDGRREWVDVDGDGRPDLVVAYDDRLVVFHSLGREGFAAPVTLRRPGAAPSLAERPDVDLFFADMSGDGLLDLVRVAAGRVEYWPHLGNGELGAPVLMDGILDIGTATFDSRRLRFVDLDGSGTTDVLYLGSGEVRWWTNAAGNRLVEGGRLTGLPVFDNLSAVQVLDFLGDGTPCLVWSSALPADAEAPLQFLRLTDGVRPRLLTAVRNGIGRETRLAYSSSSRHYLRDLADRPWRTRLPSHTLVVDRREVVDLITGSCAVTRYEYHDGYFDTAERMFRGFLQVDRYDTVGYDEFAALPDADLTTPGLVRTWHHPGLFGAEPALLTAAWTADPDEPLLARSGPEAPVSLDDTEFVEAYRALAGRQVREEAFAVGPDGRRVEHPHTVTQRTYAVRRLSPGVLLTYQREAVTAAYEEDPADPRICRSIAVEVDDYGELLRTRSVAEARRMPDPDVPEQARRQVTANERTVLHVDTPDRYLTGLSRDSRDFAFDGPDGTARLTGWDRVFYCDDAGSALPFGQVGAVVLPHHDESACFTPQQVQQVYGGLVTEQMLREEARYRLADGYWWRPGPTYHHRDADGFRLVRQVEQPDGGILRVTHDQHLLAVVRLDDDAGNSTRAELDYHQFAPWRITDANGTVTEARYDPLGAMGTSTSYGHVRDPATGAAQTYGADPLDATAAPPVPAGVADVLADPLRYLGRAGRYTYHDCLAWTERSEPTATVVVTRQELVHDGAGGGTGTGAVHVAIAYVDGSGMPVQTKELAAGGRWRADGHVVHDPKGQPVRQYRPYFAAGPGYAADPQPWMQGTPVRTAYDASGRMVRRELPDGTQERITHRAWSVRFEDANDTVATSRYRLEREQLPTGDADRQALDKALAHADTPTVLHLDPFGREVLRVEHGTPTRRTRTRLDHDGTPLALTDPRGLVAFRYDHDLAGRTLRERSIDAGEQLTLPDVVDQPIHTWDSRGTHVQTGYDRLGRARTVTVDGRVVERYTYGDQPGAVSDPALRNACGRLVRHEDQAGVVTVDSFTPDGAPRSSTRRLRVVVDSEPDWVAGEALEPQRHVSSARYDAIGRTVEQRLPDGSVRTYAHLTGGGVDRVMVTLNGTTVEILSAAEYDVDGQPAVLRLGNGAVTTYERSPETSLLRRLSTESAGVAVQDLRITRDPVGNITRLLDLAQQPSAPTPLLSGLTVSAHRDFTYDPHYRLVTATGRLHQALLEHDDRGGPGTFKGTRHLTLANGAALERFTRTYAYDDGGNVREIRHSGVTSSWTATRTTSATSNRMQPGSYDAAGNTAALPHLSSLEWSYRNQLRRAVVIDRPGGVADDERYVLDGDGQRIRRLTRRLVSGEVELTEVLYLDGCEIRRATRGGVVTLARVTSHISDGEQHLATIHRWSTDVAAQETNDLTRRRVDFEVPDHQGAVALVLNEDGGVVSYEEYFPFGGTALLAGPIVRELRRRDHRFGGNTRDDTTGLYWFGYRCYAPWIGGWLSPDPAGPQDSLNLYEYCRNNPVNRVDTDGLDSTTDYRPLTGVDSRFNEAQARAAFNAGVGAEMGVRVLELRRRGTSDWEIVRSEPTPRLRELIEETGDVDAAIVLHQVEQALQPLKDLQFAPLPGAGPDTPAGTESGSGGKQGTGGTDDAQQPATSIGRTKERPAKASGTGAQRDGPGAAEKGSATGGGGTDTRTTGSGTQRTGTAPRGVGGGGQGAGEQITAGAPDGVEGGAAVSGPPGGASGGAEGGMPDGVVGGALDGVVGGAPATTGGIPDTAGTPGGVDPNGSPDGGRFGTRDQGAGSGAGDKPGSSPQGTGGNGAGGRTMLDTFVRYAGYWHLEFGGGKDGVSGGIPGGMDVFGLGLHGAGWQAAFLVLTVVDMIGTALTLGQVKAAAAGLKAGLRKLVTQAKHILPMAKGWLDDVVKGGLSKLATLVKRRGVIDPVVDTDVLVAAWRAARRGATDATALQALAKLRDKAYQWVVTPTTFKEFVRKLPSGSASRRRFLDSLPNVEIMNGAKSSVLHGRARFQQVMTELRAIANRSVPGLGNRSVSVGGQRVKSHFNDIVNSAFAEQMKIPFVTLDRKITQWLANHGRTVGVNAKHLSDI